jgi:pilus assembly protein Flp/PilA
MRTGIVQFLRDFVSGEEGPTAVEYAVMLALIIVVCITTITTLGSGTNKTFTTAGKAAGGS